MLFLQRILLNIFYKLDRNEKKLRTYSGYKHDSVIKWKKQTGASWATISKLLNELKIYSEIEIRNAYRKLTEDNHSLFYAPNTYIIPFGKTGKSGHKLLYDFRKAVPALEEKIIEKYEIVGKENCNLIFLDDIVGTGEQATGYIISSIQQLLTTSQTPYLLTICSTPQGVYEVNQVGFRVLQFQLLSQPTHYYLDDSCHIFTLKEKELLNNLNHLLIDSGNRYHLGLLLAFYYSTPDNTMPIIWKEIKVPTKKKWEALLPREF